MIHSKEDKGNEEIKDRGKKAEAIGSVGIK